MPPKPRNGSSDGNADIDGLGLKPGLELMPGLLLGLTTEVSKPRLDIGLDK